MVRPSERVCTAASKLADSIVTDKNTEDTEEMEDASIENKLGTNGKCKRKKKLQGGNPSKRHRDRLNAELEKLANLLPFSKEVVTKLDKISILRLTVSYLRAKSFFQDDSSNASDDEKALDESNIVNNFEGNGLFSELSLEALDGFLVVITPNGEFFYVSESVSKYLGYSQAAIIHQPVFKFLHIDDHNMLKSKLVYKPEARKENAPDKEKEKNPDGDKEEEKFEENKESEDPIDVDASKAVDTDSCPERLFTCRLKCNVNHGASYYRQFKCQGRMRKMQKKKKKEDDPTEYGLFAVLSPVTTYPSTPSIALKETLKSANEKLENKPIENHSQFTNSSFPFLGRSPRDPHLTRFHHRSPSTSSNDSGHWSMGTSPSGQPLHAGLHPDTDEEMAARLYGIDKSRLPYPGFLMPGMIPPRHFYPDMRKVPPGAGPMDDKLSAVKQEPQSPNSLKNVCANGEKPSDKPGEAPNGQSEDSSTAKRMPPGIGSFVYPDIMSGSMPWMRPGMMQGLGMPPPDMPSNNGMMPVGFPQNGMFDVPPYYGLRPWPPGLWGPLPPVIDADSSMAAHAHYKNLTDADRLRLAAMSVPPPDPVYASRLHALNMFQYHSYDQRLRSMYSSGVYPPVPSTGTTDAPSTSTQSAPSMSKPRDSSVTKVKTTESSETFVKPSPVVKVKEEKDTADNKDSKQDEAEEIDVVRDDPEEPEGACEDESDLSDLIDEKSLIKGSLAGIEKEFNSKLNSIKVTLKL